LVYHECVATTKTFVRDCSEASPYALLLFCGALEARPLDGTIVVDGWASFAAGGRVAALVAALRDALDALLAAKADDPLVRTATAPVTAAITRLLLHDGLA
jgi:ATP-dependent RNA helicase DHX29